MSQHSHTTVVKTYVETEYGQMHCRQCGSGDPVLLFHQTPSSSTSFSRVLPYFSTHYHVIAIDTLGFGVSAKPDKPPRIETYGQAVVAVMDALELGRVSLVGHHTGASIALEVASTTGGRVENLVMAGLLALEDDAERSEWMAFPVRSEPGDRSQFLHEYVLPAVRRHVPAEDDEQFWLELVAFIEAGPHYWWAYDALFEYDARRRLESLAMPTLLVNAVDDESVFESTRRAALRAPGAEYVEVAGGHQVVFDQPAAFAAPILEFLARR